MNNDLVIVLSSHIPPCYVSSTNMEYLCELKKVFELNSSDNINSQMDYVYIHYSKMTLTFSLKEKKQSYPAVPLPLALKLTLSFLHKIVLLQDEACVPLHGSAVHLLDQNLIFVASSGVGKSTLVAFLILSGDASLISEDMSILNTESLNLEPIPRNILLRKNGYDILAKMYQNAMPPITYLENLQRFVFTPPIYDEKKLMVNKIIALDRDEKYSQAYLTVTEASILINNLYNVGNIVKNTMLCAKITGKTTYLTLHYNDLSQIPQVLKNHKL